MKKKAALFKKISGFNICAFFAVVHAIPTSSIEPVQSQRRSSQELLSSQNTTVKVSISCQDSSEYRSPLSTLWTCEHHKTIPCEKFALLGLNQTELDDLISSCPESCNSKCNEKSMVPSPTPTHFEESTQSNQNKTMLIEIEMYLHNKREFIRDDEKPLFQKVSLDYLRSFFLKIDGRGLYYIKSFKLNSQTFVDQTFHLRRTRDLKQSTVLKIIATIAFESESALLRKNLDSTLRLAVENDAYIQMLGNHFEFDEVEVKSSYEPDFGANQMQNSDVRTSTFIGTLTAIITTLLLIVVVVATVMFHRRRLNFRQFTSLSPQKENQSVFMDRISDDDMRKDENSFKIFKLRVDECEMKKKKQFDSESDLSQMRCYQENNIIPPMIVIDNIDDGLSNDSPTQMASTHNVDMNGKEGVLMNITNVAGLPFSVSAKKSHNTIQTNILLKECLPQQTEAESEKGSPLSLLSSRPSIDETASALSTPASNILGPDKENYSTDTNHQKKGVFSFNPDIDMEPEDDFTVLFEKKMKEGGKRSFNLKDLFKRNRAPDEEQSAQMSHYESDAELSEISSIVRGNDRMLCQSTSHSIRTNESDQSIEGNLASPTSNENTQVSQSENNVRVASSCCSEGSSSNNLSKSWFLYTFEAPISGKLGIVIQSTRKLRKNDSNQINQIPYGPSVLKIKDYSPLLGMVTPGDMIVSVDSVNTQRMSTSEITTMLEHKRCQSDDGKIKIAVVSKEEKYGFEAEAPDHLLLPECSTDSLLDNGNTMEGENGVYMSSSESEGSFHLIDTGMSEDDDSFHMMAGSEDFM